MGQPLDALRTLDIGQLVEAEEFILLELKARLPLGGDEGTGRFSTTWLRWHLAVADDKGTFRSPDGFTMTLVGTKHSFTKAERWAVWLAYDGQCFWCEEPFDFNNCTIDHVIPERLVDDPKELLRVTTLYRLGSEFAINSFANWVPSHQRCNGLKASMVFDPSPAFLFILVRVKRRALKASLIHTKAISDKEADKVLGALEVAIEAKSVSLDRVRQLLRVTQEQTETLPALAASASNELEPVLIVGGWSIIGRTGDLAYVSRGPRTGIA